MEKIIHYEGILPAGFPVHATVLPKNTQAGFSIDFSKFYSLSKPACVTLTQAVSGLTIPGYFASSTGTLQGSILAARCYYVGDIHIDVSDAYGAFQPMFYTVNAKGALSSIMTQGGFFGEVNMALVEPAPSEGVAQGRLQAVTCAIVSTAKNVCGGAYHVAIVASPILGYIPTKGGEWVKSGSVIEREDIMSTPAPCFITMPEDVNVDSVSNPRSVYNNIGDVVSPTAIAQLTVVPATLEQTLSVSVSLDDEFSEEVAAAVAKARVGDTVSYAANPGQASDITDELRQIADAIAACANNISKGQDNSQIAEALKNLEPIKALEQLPDLAGLVAERISMAVMWQRVATKADVQYWANKLTQRGFWCTLPSKWVRSVSPDLPIKY